MCFYKESRPDQTLYKPLSDDVIIQSWGSPIDSNPICIDSMLKPLYLTLITKNTLMEMLHLIENISLSRPIKTCTMNFILKLMNGFSCTFVIALCVYHKMESIRKIGTYIQTQSMWLCMYIHTPNTASNTSRTQTCTDSAHSIYMLLITSAKSISTLVKVHIYVHSY